jgi:hypothetical protein
MERKRSARSRRYRGTREKSTCTKIKDCLREFIAFMFSNVGIIGLVVGYTICGAFMFGAIESKTAGEERNAAIRALLEARVRTAKRLWEITHELSFAESETEWKTKVLEQLANYQDQVIKAQANGYDGADNLDAKSTSSQQWAFPGAFLYSLTVITTIGKSMIYEFINEYY